jgi:hypothetical protein
MRPFLLRRRAQGRCQGHHEHRDVHTFARIPTRRAGRGTGEGAWAGGLAGICLDAQRGYVFVTFTYQAEDGVLRNYVVRFETKLPEKSSADA